MPINLVVKAEEHFEAAQAAYGRVIARCEVMMNIPTWTPEYRAMEKQNALDNKEGKRQGVLMRAAHLATEKGSDTYYVIALESYEYETGIRNFAAEAAEYDSLQQSPGAGAAQQPAPAPATIRKGINGQSARPGHVR